MLYRVLESLKFVSTGRRLEAGTIDRLEGCSPETIAMLLAKNRIAEVQPPPLAILPDFKGEKAEAYAQEGIHNVIDLAGAEDVSEVDLEAAKSWCQPGYTGPEVDEDECVE